MLFVASVNVPAGTPANNPVKKTIRLEPGVLRKVEIVFPFGCNCLVGVKIAHGEKIIIPRNAKEWVVGNGETVHIDTLLEHYDEPFELTIYASSPGTNYDHTVYFRFHVLDPELAFPERRLARLLEDIAKRLYARRIG